MTRPTLLTLALLAPLLGSLAPPAAGAPPDERMTALLDADLEFKRRASPVGASLDGDRRYDDRWPDVSPEALAQQEEALEARRVEAQALLDGARPELSDRLVVAGELLVADLDSRLAGHRFSEWRMPVTQQQGPHVGVPQLPERLSFTRTEHVEDWVARLDGFGDYVDGIIENMRAGLSEGRTPPKVTLRDVAGQAASLTGERFAQSPEEHPMWAPLESPASTDALRERARAAMLNVVLPAWGRYAAFLEDEYVPGARETIAATALPDGAAYYGAMLERHTTVDATAERIHETGLDEVERIRGEMLAVIRETGFADDRPEMSDDALFDAFTAYLRTDSRFYHDSAEDLLTHYRDICKRMDAHLPALFGTLPRLPYGVRALPERIAPSAATAYYYPGSMDNGVAGRFMANTHALDQRPKYEAVALALHEAVPGHHLQIALAQELEDRGLHEWRTTVGFTAFTEGWGLYAERLGLEVGGGERGMYADPYDEFGRLSYEMWRAMRLVVDTGIHAMGWSREEAIDYMLANSALSEANVVSEVDRYIAWPGQAVGYKFGEIFIRDLRARAEGALGDAFDVRAFHDVVLGAGSVTLPVLERRVDAWIERTKAEGGGPGEA